MCEILTVKHNGAGLRFSETAIETALNFNDDGAGFLILEKNGKDSWKLIKKETYPLNSYGEDLEKFYLKNITKERKKKEEEQKKKNKEKQAERKRKYPALFGFSPTGHIAEVKPEFDEYDDEYNDGFFGEFDSYEEYKNGCKIYHYKGGKTIWEKELDAKEKNEKDEKKAHEQAEEDLNEYKDTIIDEFMELQDNLEKNQLLLMHFRIATSGKNGKNTQPIEKENYIVIHNGIFTAKGDEKMSDTAEFTKDISNKAKKIKNLTPKKEKSIITREINSLSGSYSIFIYSKLTGRLYYYKNEKTNFSWIDPDQTLGATCAYRFPNNYQEGASAIIK